MSGCRCLVVEDSPTVRELIAQALGRLPGLEVVQACDGVDALRKLPGTRIDLVLTAGAMPMLDGFRLVEVLRGNPATAGIPVVMIAEEGGREQGERGGVPGVRAVIPRPVRAASVVAAVREILGPCSR